MSISDITNASFEKSNTLASCNPTRGKYMACSLMFRGDVLPKDAIASI
jgi:tubulin alpha